ncbi:hypothetical protein EPI10_012674 [Gossypium australe]|uniref:Uncharacterized protein n=1 Tax=Gossypium australe TaxID=47621 RepID=A0A5B6UM55_9ROSI|nr:hypothetical protein EPI10_012674 [Gossypium australe]
MYKSDFNSTTKWLLPPKEVCNFRCSLIRDLNAPEQFKIINGEGSTMEGEDIMEKANAIVKDLLKEVSISLPASRKQVNKKRKATLFELSTGGEQHREGATFSAKDLTTEVNPPSGTFDHVSTPFTVVAANNSNPSITIDSSIQPIAAMIGSSFVGRVSPSMLIVVLPANFAAALILWRPC